MRTFVEEQVARSFVRETRVEHNPGRIIAALSTCSGDRRESGRFRFAAGTTRSATRDPADSLPCLGMGWDHGRSHTAALSQLVRVRHPGDVATVTAHDVEVVVAGHSCVGEQDH
jgi:hypothetical protein